MSISLLMEVACPTWGWLRWLHTFLTLKCPNMFLSLVVLDGFNFFSISIPHPNERPSYGYPHSLLFSTLPHGGSLKSFLFALLNLCEVGYFTDSSLWEVWSVPSACLPAIRGTGKGLRWVCLWREDAPLFIRRGWRSGKMTGRDSNSFPSSLLLHFPLPPLPFLKPFPSLPSSWLAVSLSTQALFALLPFSYLSMEL